MALEFLEWTIGTSQLLRWHTKLVIQKQPHNHTVTWKVVVLPNTYEQLAGLVSGFRNKSSETNLYVHRWSSNDELNVCMFEQRSLVFWTHSEQLSLPIATKGCLGFGTFSARIIQKIHCENIGCPWLPQVHHASTVVLSFLRLQGGKRDRPRRYLGGIRFRSEIGWDDGA